MALDQRPTCWASPRRPCSFTLGSPSQRDIPHISIFPVSVTDLDRQALQNLAIDMPGWLKAEVMWIFAWLTFAAISTASGHRSGLGPAFAPASIGVVAATIALFCHRMFRTRTIP
jgi:hypothetical protein